MKSNLYWLKVGLFIGVGIFLAYWLLPFVLLLGAFFVSTFLVLVLPGTLAAAIARPLKALRCDRSLRRGWATRARR